MKRLTLFLNKFSGTLLIGILPVFFLYGHNATLLRLANLVLPLLGLVLLSILSHLLFLSPKNSLPDGGTIAPKIFITLVWVYGFFFDFLVKIDMFQVAHATLLPVYLILGFLLSKFLEEKLIQHQKNINLFANVIFGGLVLFNLITIATTEINKYQINQLSTAQQMQAPSNPETASLPDVYYIIVDEAARFDVVRTYWGYTEVDEFESFLVSQGFFIANQSQSDSGYTLYEIATRLNFETYPTTGEFSEQDFYQAIAQNKVMHYFKQMGYSTIALDQVHAANGHPNKIPIIADYNLKAPTSHSQNWLIDDFTCLVFDFTILRPVCNSLRQSDPALVQHRTDVLFFFDKLANLDDIPSPKFVYAHVLLTHVPFIFAEDGTMLNTINAYNWNYYLDSYKFQITKLTHLVNEILAEADPENPPIIIIQSDHGVRNKDGAVVAGRILPEFPKEYKYYILNALYLPGYDTSTLPDDLKPINTFPIIFNHYFDDQIPLFE